jgi:hypothetical protein
MFESATFVRRGELTIKFYVNLASRGWLFFLLGEEGRGNVIDTARIQLPRRVQKIMQEWFHQALLLYIGPCNNVSNESVNVPGRGHVVPLHSLMLCQ